MKIIKQGKVEAIWWVGAIATCARCGTEVELEMGDDVIEGTTIEHGEHTANGFCVVHQTTASIKCPVCGLWCVAVEVPPLHAAGTARRTVPTSAGKPLDRWQRLRPFFPHSQLVGVSL